jgi:hypothetical protein
MVFTDLFVMAGNEPSEPSEGTLEETRDRPLRPYQTPHELIADSHSDDDNGSSSAPFTTLTSSDSDSQSNVNVSSTIPVLMAADQSQ